MLQAVSKFGFRFASNLSHFEGSLEELSGLIKEKKGLVVVDFYADWCGPCKKLGQIMPKIAEANKDVTFLKTNIDENTDLAEHYGIDVIPQIKFFKGNSDPIATVVGLNVQGIEENILKYM